MYLPLGAANEYLALGAPKREVPTKVMGAANSGAAVGVAGEAAAGSVNQTERRLSRYSQDSPAALANP